MNKNIFVLKQSTITLIMLFVGILFQLITFAFTNDNLLYCISGIIGIFSVVYCSERKLTYYIFSFLQIITYSYICLEFNLYGKLLENIFYFITGIIGVYIWKNNLYDNSIVITKTLNTKKMFLVILANVIGILLLIITLNMFNGNSIYLDAISTIIAITAQILMMLRYRENWILWFIVNIICVILWINEKNWCMVMQYVFWIVNCVYGYILWGKIKNFEKKQ